MPRCLVIKVEMPDDDSSWTIAIQRARLEVSDAVDRQLIVRRGSRDKVLCVPEVGKPNFVLSVTEEVYES